jgi:hypothetical protein
MMRPENADPRGVYLAMTTRGNTLYVPANDLRAGCSFLTESFEYAIEETVLEGSDLGQEWTIKLAQLTADEWAELREMDDWG